MDPFGNLANAASLLQQTFHLFRHVSSARDFADIAGNFSAMIAVEYFRFETWIQQSGLLSIDSSGKPVVEEGSIRRCLQLAAQGKSLLFDGDKAESNIIRIVSQVHRCLEQLNKLRDKYALVELGEQPASPQLVNQSSLPTQEEAFAPAFQNQQITKGISSAARQRQRLSKGVSFFRKVNFGWSITNDTSDKDKTSTLIQNLKYYNDALRETMPLKDQSFADQVVNLRALALSNVASELRGIGKAAHVMEGQLYDDLYSSASIKARRAEANTRTVTAEELEQMQIEKAKISQIEELAQKTQEPNRQLTSYNTGHTTNSNPSEVVLLEWTLFNETLESYESDVLNARVARLCTLLGSLDRPSSLILPRCEGYIRWSRTQFALAYQLPSFADPQRDTYSLYSIMRANKHSIKSEKLKQLWPTLKQRYLLASVLADGLLSLLSVDWVHKSLNSCNIVLFHEKGSAQSVDFSRPQMMGFGIARPELPGENTIDVRSLDSPLSLWQHPELRQGPHHRFERRHDIYSFGIILFEIGMWQDLHYYSKERFSAFDFHQRIVNVCERELGHYMGEPYQQAVLTCIDQDDLWKAAGRESEDDSAILELFSLDVVKVLKQCSVSRGI